VGVLDEPLPGHLYRIERVGFPQSKRPHRRGHEFAVSADDLIPGRSIASATVLM
jgi:hypothetical protein